MTQPRATTCSTSAPASGQSTPPRSPTRRVGPFDPPRGLDRLRREAPVSRLAFPGGTQGWLVTRWQDVRVVLSDDARFSAQRSATSNPVREISPEMAARMQERSQAGMFLSMDPPEHTGYRRRLISQFTVRRMRELAPRIEEIVDQHLDAMAVAGPPADLVTAFALPVPSLVICELLGVCYDDRDEFQHRTAQLLNLNTPPEILLDASDSLREFIHGLVRTKRRQPDDALLSRLIHTEDPAGPLSDDELVNIATLLLVAGHETTANMLALGSFALLEHPAQLERLRRHPELIGPAVEELLRYLSIVHLGVSRTAREDVELGGQHLRAGETIVVSLPEANRDPDQFDRPDQLDVSRRPTPHLAFGHGVHQCLGQQLARVEMTVGFSGLLARFPTLRLAVPPDQVPLRHDMAVYGVHLLPVTWDEVRP